MNTVTLSQVNPAAPAWTTETTLQLVRATNVILKEANVRLKETDNGPIQIKAVQRHYSNDLVLHVETPAHAKALKDTASSWLPSLSQSLAIKPDLHAVLVHGVPTTFDPAIEEHLEDLRVSNGEMLSSMTSVRWVNPKAIEDGEKHFSSLIILLTNADHASQCVKEQVWYRFKKRRTEAGRRPPVRCYNCLKTGHTASACPATPLCPHCGDDHLAHTCKFKNNTVKKCTSCARAKKELSPHLTMKNIFEGFETDLAHSPFSPLCAVRVARGISRLTPSSEHSRFVAAEDDTMTSDV